MDTGFGVVAGGLVYSTRLRFPDQPVVGRLVILSVAGLVTVLGAGVVVVVEVSTFPFFFFFFFFFSSSSSSSSSPPPCGTSQDGGGGGMERTHVHSNISLEMLIDSVELSMLLLVMVRGAVVVEVVVVESVLVEAVLSPAVATEA